MKVFVKYDINKICRDLLTQELKKHAVDFQLTNIGELHITDRGSQKVLAQIKQELALKGINIVDNDKLILVERIKTEIVNLIANNTVDDSTLSEKLAKNFNHTYSYLAKVFSETTHATIESFTILAKIEEVKTLLIQNQLSLTEISYRLNYSSVAHLSRQFKKTTGLTPTEFKEIISKRQQIQRS